MSGVDATGDEVVRKDRTKTGATRSRAEAERDEKPRPNIFRRVIIYISQVISELKKVNYPTGKETWTYFLVVIFFVAAIMLFTGVLDYGFGKLNAVIFG